MPKTYAKRLSLHPLSFEDAIKKIVSADPDRIGLTPKRRKKRERRRPKSEKE